MTHERTPLVIAASKPVLEKARRLGLARPLENLVGEAIEAGRIAGTPGVGNETNVRVEPDVVVRVRRTRSPLTGRKAWVPVGVARAER